MAQTVAHQHAGATEDVASISELGRSPGEGTGNPCQYSCLENPMDSGASHKASDMIEATQHSHAQGIVTL